MADVRGGIPHPELHSDDTFSDFQRGLVGLGRSAYENAIKDADTLADDPLIRAIAAGQVDRYEAFDCEGVHFAASTAYGRKSGDDEDYWEALQDLPDEERAPSTWSGDFGSREDAELIPQRLPRLSALFARLA